MHLKSCWTSLSHLPQSRPHSLLVSPPVQGGQPLSQVHGPTSGQPYQDRRPSSLIGAAGYSLNYSPWLAGCKALSGQAGSEVSLLGQGMELKVGWEIRCLAGMCWAAVHFHFSAAQATRISPFVTLQALARKRADKALSICLQQVGDP